MHIAQITMAVYVENKLKTAEISQSSDFIQKFLINAVKINAQIKHIFKKLCKLLKLIFSKMYKEFNTLLCVIN